MEAKKFIFVLCHAKQNPLEAVIMMKTATNMIAFDDTIDIDFFLIGEAVLLAKKGVAETMSVELEGQKVSVAEMLNTLTQDFNVKFFVCHTFMPEYGVAKEDLIESAELKSSAYLGELMLDGRMPFHLGL